MGCTGCSSEGGCAHLAITHDWLDNMLPPDLGEKDNIYEIRFKATRKGFFRNKFNHNLSTGELVVVDCDRGYDVGRVSMGGELVRLQMKKKRIDAKHVQNIQRVAGERELNRLEELRSHERDYVIRTRAIVHTLKLNMKISDIEFQADGSKALFYYTADYRVDFRELIKTLANEFKIRVEMRQIGARQEAGRIGGVGSCGRELCCSSWLSDFKTVNTSAARYQNLSLNPLKITGQCGRLKCCLNYELETYMDALKSIPNIREIQTEQGTAYLTKTDIFQQKMWFTMPGQAAWVQLQADQVREIKRMNDGGEKPAGLGEFERAVRESQPRQDADLPDFIDVVGQSNLHERVQKKGKDNNRRRDRPASEARATPANDGKGRSDTRNKTKTDNRDQPNSEIESEVSQEEKTRNTQKNPATTHNDPKLKKNPEEQKTSSPNDSASAQSERNKARRKPKSRKLGGDELNKPPGENKPTGDEAT